MVVLIVGYFVKVFTLSFEGLAGWALGDEASRSFSLWELGHILPYKTDYPDGFGIRML